MPISLSWKQQRSWSHLATKFSADKPQLLLPATISLGVWERNPKATPQPLCETTHSQLSDGVELRLDFVQLLLND
jgi:hypothetical protein